MKTTHSFSAVLLISSVVSAAWCQAPTETARVKITPIEAFGDLSDVLRIRKFVASYQLPQKATKVTLRLDFYQKGQKLSGKSFSTGYKTLKELASDSGKFAVHIIDLDYLTIGGGKAGNHRVNLQLTLGDDFAANHVDVPKNLFDISQSWGMTQFRADPGTKNSALLFAMVGNSSKIGGGRTAEEVVKMNPDGDVMIATLEFE